MAPDEQREYPRSPLRVQDLPKREQPRELFDRVGADNVSDSVLLAIILRTGVPGMNVMDLATRLLAEYGTLSGLAQAPDAELLKIPGLGPVKVQSLKAALQLARRIAEEAAPERNVIRTPADVAALLREEARGLEGEIFWVLLLDTRNNLKAKPHVVSRGILDASLVHAREVFKEAVRRACAAVILAHNHPSGDPTPSSEDIKITRSIVEAGRVVDIHVLDHVILGQRNEERDTDYVSLREMGLVEFSGG